MSVPTWNRNDSKMKFLAETYHLSEDIISFISHLPTKYRTGVGDEIERELVSAMHNGKLANSIYPLNSKSELHERRYHLLQMLASIDTIATFTTLLIELQRKSDGISLKQVGKLRNKEERIGLKCSEISKCILGLVDSDIKRWNQKYPDNRIARKWRMKSAAGDIRFNNRTMEIHHVPENDKIDDEYIENLPLEEIPEYVPTFKNTKK